MNVAFPALLLFLMVLPGFIFQTLFRRTEKTYLEYRPFAERTVIAIFFASLFHGIALGVLEWQFSIQPDFQHFVVLLIGSKSTSLTDDAVRQVGDHFILIAGYLLVIYLLAALLGFLGRRVVMFWQLDRRGRPFSNWLRFDTPWYYLFKGYDESPESSPDGVLIAGIVTVGKEAFLYTGLLVDYFLDEAGNLDRLVLSETQRRKLENDKDSQAGSSSQRFYPVDGNYFVLRYSELLTLNVLYIELESS